ncbi:Non-selective Cation Channel-2 (NSCC2) Family [Achlya hypogyna]|uniref:Translocation protein SEC62 n=1 Tax=Achlya hypogyna TaxID=1202772 RepID=A0A1V9YXL8_ACHHY|nr:Non-selective Cation Channel-2 (NSCC2) Family [Achlya hypogyna]
MAPLHHEAATLAMDTFLQQQFVSKPADVVAPALPQPTLLDVDATQVVADTLRRRKAAREAIEMERRVEYIRGKELRRCFPEATPEQLASYGHSLLEHGFLHRSDRVSTKKVKGTTTMLAISKDQSFVEDGYYTWMYEGSSAMRNVLTSALVVVAGVCTLYPLWPRYAQMQLWNAGVTLGLVGFTIAAVRLGVWLSIWLATGRHTWMFPAFPVMTPLIDTDAKRTTAPWKRVFVAALLIALGMYFVVHPVSFGKRGVIGFGRQLVKEAYRGTVLNRFSQEEKDFVYGIFRILRRLLV